MAETDGLIPSSSKCGRFRGLLTRAMIRSTRYFSLRHLADQHVVLVVAGHRDHHVGALDIPARSSTQSSEASPYWTLCSSSCSTVR